MATNGFSNIEINLHAKEISSLSGQTLAVFSKAGLKKDSVAQITHSETAKALSTTLEDRVITGAVNEALSFREARFLGYRNVITVGLGATDKLNHEVVRQAAAALYKEAKAIKSTEVFVDFDGLVSGKKNQPEFMRAFVEGLELCSYNFDELKTSAKKKTEPIQNIQPKEQLEVVQAVEPVSASAMSAEEYRAMIELAKNAGPEDCEMCGS